MLYLGKLADMDTNNNDNDVENIDAIKDKTFGSSGDPLFAQSTRVTLNDNGGTKNVVEFDHNQARNNTDTIKFTIDGVTYTAQADSVVLVKNATIVQQLPGGGTTTITATVRILQDVNGNTFLMPPRSSGADTSEANLVKYPIISIKIPKNPNYESQFSGIDTSRVPLEFRDGYVDGTDGNDSIKSGYTDGSGDKLDGNDAILPGMTGNDDHIRAGAGDDWVEAGQGNDIVDGDIGNDTLKGGAGNDTIYGGEGNDSLFGDAGNDKLDGGVGDDSLYGGDGDDRLEGKEGNDALYGDAGKDMLYGGEGDDLLYGGGGSDSLYGGAGDDTLDGGDGADQLTGGEGFDRFIVGKDDTVLDFNTGNGQYLTDRNQSNNDFVDLSAYYNAQTLQSYNAWAKANNQPTYRSPLHWLRADQADGVLDAHQNLNLRIQNGGQRVNPDDLTWDNTNVLCFSSNALILTQNGEIKAGALRVGDVVLTQDAGAQSIRWIGTRHLSAEDFAQNPKLRPIRIGKGALGNGLPHRDLLLSPQHRLLIRSKIAGRMFGASEVLVAAKDLCQIDGVDLAEDIAEITYLHILFDQHHILLANGIEAESMLTGPEALKSLPRAALEELLALFPDLAAPDYRAHSARLIASGKRGRKLVERHLANDRPFQSAS